MKLFSWLDNDASVAQRQHRIFLHADITGLIGLESAKCGQHLPMAWHLAEPRQPRVLIFRIRLQILNHPLASTGPNCQPLAAAKSRRRLLMALR
jgi:hypothetical protein